MVATVKPHTPRWIMESKNQTNKNKTKEKKT